MEFMDIIQSVLTYILTGGVMGLITYISRLSKRLTILEEHDKEQVKAFDRINTLTEKLTKIDTKLDLLLEGKLK